MCFMAHSTRRILEKGCGAEGEKFSIFQFNFSFNDCNGFVLETYLLNNEYLCFAHMKIKYFTTNWIVFHSRFFSLFPFTLTSNRENRIKQRARYVASFRHFETTDKPAFLNNPGLIEVSGLEINNLNPTTEDDF